MEPRTPHEAQAPLSHCHTQPPTTLPTPAGQLTII